MQKISSSILASLDRVVKDSIFSLPSSHVGKLDHNEFGIVMGKGLPTRNYKFITNKTKDLLGHKAK